MDPEQVILTDDQRFELERFRSSHETKVLTIFFSDLVGSTQLQVEHGNLAAASMVQKHYEVLREALRNFEGKEISTAGDSMLIVFLAPADAIRFALSVQKKMRAIRTTEKLMPLMRCGIHHGQVVLQMETNHSELSDIYGVQVSTTARIMSLGEGDQILLSRAVYDDARTVLSHGGVSEYDDVKWMSHGTYRFKGVPDDFEVCEVGETRFAALAAPQNSEKAWSVSKPSNARVAVQKTWSTLYRVGKYALIALVALMMLSAVMDFCETMYLTPYVDQSEDEAVASAPSDRLAQIEKQLRGIEGIEKDVANLASLEEKYEEARSNPWGNTPLEVQDESRKFLDGLRVYDLNKEERKAFAEAQATAQKQYSLFPENLFVPVRNLAYLIEGRQKKLVRERSQLQALLNKSTEPVSK